MPVRHHGHPACEISWAPQLFGSRVVFVSERPSSFCRCWQQNALVSPRCCLRDIELGQHVAIGFSIQCTQLSLDNLGNTLVHRILTWFFKGKRAMEISTWKMSCLSTSTKFSTNMTNMINSQFDTICVCNLTYAPLNKHMTVCRKACSQNRPNNAFPCVTPLLVIKKHTLSDNHRICKQKH